MRPIACLLALLLAGISEAGACASELDSLSDRALHKVEVNVLHWLAGEWQSGDQENGSWQYISCPRGGMMLGLQQDLKNGQSRFFEYQRYQNAEDGVMLLAQPRGSDITGFVLIESAANRAVFENRLHDYPQQIELSLDQDTLSAEIRGNEDGEAKSSRWQWQRVGSDPGCQE